MFLKCAAFRSLWLWAKPHFHKLGEFIIKQSQMVWQWLVTNVPVYYEIAVQYISQAVTATATTIDRLING